MAEITSDDALRALHAGAASLTAEQREDIISCLRYKALRILGNDPDEAHRLGSLSDQIDKETS